MAGFESLKCIHYRIVEGRNNLSIVIKRNMDYSVEYNYYNFIEKTKGNVKK